jgi:RNA polymerase sigma factor for flagellar operon FliA
MKQTDANASGVAMVEDKTEAPARPVLPPAPPSKREELTRLWLEYKSNADPTLRNRLIEAYYYLVKVIGNRIAARLPRSIDVQDLRSAGVFGLMSAIDNFDLSRGTPFESYCATRIRGAILDELRSQDWVPRLVRNRASMYATAVTQLRQRLGREPSVHETAAQLGLSDDETDRLRREANLTSVFTLAPQDDREDDPRVLRKLDVLMDRESEAPFERMVLHDLAKSLVNWLQGPERTVIALYYQERLTMKEIGHVMGISESRVCQIHSKTLKKLKTYVEGIGERARRARDAD